MKKPAPKPRPRKISGFLSRIKSGYTNRAKALLKRLGL